MFTAEPSYFNFLMDHRSRRRVSVPFAQAAGIAPGRAGTVRSRRSLRLPAVRLPAVNSRGRAVASGA